MLSSFVLWVDVLEMEPRVASIEAAGVGAGELLVAEAPDIVLPSASVVVKSHCFASSDVLGLICALLAGPP